jgi:mannose/fructose/N-acetylgalactosamine-specific phosphotransferase system component IID
MGSIRKEILIGVLVSVFATLSGAFIYIEFFSEFEFEETLKVIKEQDLIGKVLSLAAIPNLFVFFIFIKKKQDYRARGVLLTTILIALITFTIKFI